MTPDNAEILATTCILPVALIVRGSIDIHHLEFYNCVSRMMPPPLAAHGTESLRRRRKIEGLHGAAS